MPSPKGRAAEYQHAMQRYSLQSVTARERAKVNEAWTDDEVEILLDPEMSLIEKIDTLQRTYYSMLQAGVRYREMMRAM